MTVLSVRDTVRRTPSGPTVVELVVLVDTPLPPIPPLLLLLLLLNVPNPPPPPPPLPPLPKKSLPLLKKPPAKNGSPATYIGRGKARTCARAGKRMVWVWVRVRVKRKGMGKGKGIALTKNTECKRSEAHT